jgi:hypothetical protein
MTQISNFFEQIAARFETDGVPGTLELLETHFRRQKEYFHLFEVLKLRCRHKLGLLLAPSQSSEQLPERQQRELDEGLLDACQTVGTLLFRDGNIQHGWTYLQPVGNRKLTESLIREVTVNDENADLLIDIALNQGAAPAYGYQLTLDHHGTCSAITAFEVQGVNFDRNTQALLASQLLHHIYNEVMQNIRAHIEQSEETARPDADLRELLQDHSWLVQQQAYHLDATHLSSLMKIARLTTSPEDHERALQLAEYGAGFPEDLQYANPAPFDDTYGDHKIFFNALLGKEIEAAVGHFKRKCSDAATTFGSQADEILIDLLFRVGRIDDAITHAQINPIDPSMRTGLALDIIEMANTPAQFATLLKHLQEQDDLLGYAFALLKRNEIQNR